ncbi:hypothetical protein [Qipengyuania gaetbuli]|uniref:hypothetical protein n=1 Tax=Qipengyuania gaetbuli TaxID=266952 RepID=UPI001CFF3900|nr:hypothetical protein [Qipengyuania gaetbuli]
MRFAFLPIVALSIAACAEAPEAEAPETASTEEVSPAPADAEEDIRHFLLQEYPDAAPMQYALAWSDLNGDGADEAIVHIITPYFCGTGGCNTLVLTPAGPMWSKVAEISVSRTPISVLDSETNGWKDLAISVSGGGGPSGMMRLAFDGESYPSNPTVAPAEPTEEAGTVLLPEEPEMKTLEAEAKSGE